MDLGKSENMFHNLPIISCKVNPQQLIVRCSLGNIGAVKNLIKSFGFRMLIYARLKPNEKPYGSFD